MDGTNNTKEGFGLPSSTLRIIDANLNRLREGIRVIEDIRRYSFDDKTLATSLKTLRHQARLNNIQELLSARDIVGDVLKATTSSEATRESLESVQLANMKRAQESARVLEEILKISDTAAAETFKHIRYELYDIEKKLF